VKEEKPNPEPAEKPEADAGAVGEAPTESAATGGLELPIDILEDTAINEADLESVDLTLLQAQAAEYLDGWQRSRAEFSNYKKRTEKEAEDSRARNTAELMTHFLPVLDDLERALKDRPQDGDGARWAEGIELIYRKLGALLDAQGIETIPANGERFDPMVHEALTLEESPEHDEGMVIEVIQQGYRLGDRVLRPALVRVAK
jgi:molecular chaperone GrpE